MDHYTYHRYPIRLDGNYRNDSITTLPQNKHNNVLIVNDVIFKYQ